jgi:hypothetical protein
VIAARARDERSRVPRRYYTPAYDEVFAGMEGRKVVPWGQSSAQFSSRIVLTELHSRHTKRSSIVQAELLDTDADKYRRLQCCLRKATAAVFLQFNFS